MAGKRVWQSATQWVYEDAIHYKDPSAITDYAIDLAHGGANDGTSTDPGWLQGDTINSVAWTVPSGITSTTNSHTNTIATIWLSGGTAGTDYLVTARVTTAAGRVDDWSLLIKVRDS